MILEQFYANDMCAGRKIIFGEFVERRVENRVNDYFGERPSDWLVSVGIRDWTYKEWEMIVQKEAWFVFLC